jgi:RimJ/RimL family protein N-acetyltransferase
MSAVELREGSRVEIRLLEASDRERLVKLFYRLSPESVYRRFLSPIHDPSESGLDRLVDIDHQDREAVAALSGEEIVGVARYFRNPDRTSADIAVVIEDSWQGRGLSLVLVDRLRDLAERRGIAAFTATMLSENRAAIRMVRRIFPGAVFTLNGTEMNALMQLKPQLP